MGCSLLVFIIVHYKHVFQPTIFNYLIFIAKPASSYHHVILKMVPIGVGVNTTVMLQIT